MSAREPTEAAKAAKMIRQALTAQGLAVKVKSRNFSMGDAVDVFLTDHKPEIAALVRAYCGKFQEGHFDAMTDCYEYSKNSSNLPRVKFVHVTNEMSDEMREAVYQHVRAHWHGGENLPPTYAEGQELSFNGTWVSQFVYRLFTSDDSTFWKSQKKAA